MLDDNPEEIRRRHQGMNPRSGSRDFTRKNLPRIILFVLFFILFYILARYVLENNVNGLLKLYEQNEEEKLAYKAVVLEITKKIYGLMDLVFSVDKGNSETGNKTKEAKNNEFETLKEQRNEKVNLAKIDKQEDY